MLLDYMISIHAPARGATSTRSSAWSNGYEFQSTLPRGERRRIGGTGRRIYPISIHAPARGATSIVMPSITGHQSISIHAPARGATLYFRHCYIVSQFQSTLPRGERPRTNYPVCLQNEISIHAPARGATPIRDRTGSLIVHFNPRSREGSDVIFRKYL